MQQRLLFPDAYPADHSAGFVPHPIPYQGSKRQLATKILAYFPEHFTTPRGAFRRLRRPLAGGGLPLPGESFWINDAHQPLVVLWQAIIDRPEELAAKYAALWKEQIGKGERVLRRGARTVQPSRPGPNTSFTSLPDA